MQPKDWRRRPANEANGIINAKVKFHLQNAVIHKAHEVAPIECSRTSASRATRAPVGIVSDEVWQGMPPDPEIAELEQRRERLKGGDRIQGRDNEQEIREVTKEMRSEKAQRVKGRADTFYNRPIWDIER